MNGSMGMNLHNWYHYSHQVNESRSRSGENGGSGGIVGWMEGHGGRKALANIITSETSRKILSSFNTAAMF